MTERRNGFWVLARSHCTLVAAGRTGVGPLRRCAVAPHEPRGNGEFLDQLGVLQPARRVGLAWPIGVDEPWHPRCEVTFPPFEVGWIVVGLYSPRDASCHELGSWLNPVRGLWHACSVLDELQAFCAGW